MTDRYITILKNDPKTSGLEPRTPKSKTLMHETWKQETEKDTISGYKILKRKHWVIANRLRIKHANTSYNVQKNENYRNHLGTHDEIGNQTPLIILPNFAQKTKLEGGYRTIQAVSDNLQIKVEVTRYYY
ncbi:hypothetical protein ElyMa_005563800 [Elysia marginata]|uniref:Uncharacterized protein n=1 Tax=Elysia marginata TaxID=1093978 RepID=A0AAV4EZT6_9GAST|nr:hypothetical protein ElyMa_005563800 [Elysia marginata]